MAPIRLFVNYFQLIIRPNFLIHRISKKYFKLEVPNRDMKSSLVLLVSIDISSVQLHPVVKIDRPYWS